VGSATSPMPDLGVHDYLSPLLIYSTKHKWQTEQVNKTAEENMHAVDPMSKQLC